MVQSNPAIHRLRVSLLLCTSFVLACCGTLDAALDPDCTPEKAARNAATKATTGIGINRCGAAETARDLTGTDGVVADVKDQL